MNLSDKKIRQMKGQLAMTWYNYNRVDEYLYDRLKELKINFSLPNHTKYIDCPNCKREMLNERVSLP